MNFDIFNLYLLIIMNKMELKESYKELQYGTNKFTTVPTYNKWITFEEE